MDLLNCRRQAQCPGWTFEKYRVLIRALFRVPLICVFVSMFRSVLLGEFGALKASILACAELVNVQPAGRWAALHQFAEAQRSSRILRRQGPMVAEGP